MINNSEKVRELKALSNRLSVTSGSRMPFTLENARDALADIIKVDLYSHLSAETIIDTVWCYCNVKKEQVLGKSRPKNVVIPRQMAMYIAREELNDSFPLWKNISIKTTVMVLSMLTNEYKKNSKIMTGREKNLKIY